jgi:predicted ATPase/DNA-binding CsgD family transcriptional regulator
VGRTEAVAEIAELLVRHRLVTVTGPGGSGKTRLAAEVAAQVAGRFADGVWLAELAAVGDLAQVASVVTVSLGVREQPGEAAAGALARVLAQRQLLLVLDNCEHVVGAAAELCAGLLMAADDLRVLATSREPLRVAGEAGYRLGPLALPDPCDPAGADRAEAVVLFADRARSADVRFALDQQIGPAVARLVRRLDGMPLAIELAAARVEALGMTQLLDRLDDCLGLLDAGDRLAPGRQRSLAATVAWSYRLLDERERQVFRAVSVFPGPFTLEGAEAVAGDDAGPAVLRLVDCSLLVPPRVGLDGRSRYVMLETLRAYGSRRLAEAGEQEQAAAALAGHALEVAGQAALALQAGAAEQTGARWLDAEDATTRQALAWAMDHDEEVALRLAVALAPWWLLRARLAGEYPRLRKVAGHAEPGSEVWCAARSWLGWAALYSIDLAGALEHFGAVCDTVADRARSHAIVDCLGGRALTLANLDRPAEAVSDGHRGLALARELGYPAGEALALTGMTVGTYALGEFDQAVQLARQAEQIPADMPGWVARLSSGVLSAALMAAGDFAAAERSCAAGLASARDADDVRNLATQLTTMTMLALLTHRFEEAGQHLRELLEIAVQAGNRLDLFNGLELCGHLCAATGRAGEAVTVWAARAECSRQLGLIDQVGDVRRREEPLRKARQTLGDTRTRAAENRGAAMGLATAAEYALLLAAPGPQPAAPPELAGLSARERELVTLVARGHTNAQIAAELFISVRTVSSHLDRIRDKTGYRRRTDLTRLALAAGLV